MLEYKIDSNKVLNLFCKKNETSKYFEKNGEALFRNK